MEEQDDRDEEVLAAQAEEYVRGFAQRLVERVVNDPNPVTAMAALVEELRSDEGGVLLLASAFEDGRRDALGSAAKFVGDSEGPDHLWSGVGPGERRALWTEQHLCLECDKQSVCVVARNVPIEHLVQVRRCLAFSPTER